jgi:ABC-type nitrate/sulfonate/bicarbonate transport system permease component
MFYATRLPGYHRVPRNLPNFKNWPGELTDKYMKKRDVLVAFLGIVIIWQLISMVARKSILPSPIQVAQTFYLELYRGLLVDFLASLWRVIASMFLSVILAAPAGLILGQSRRINRIFSPIIYLLYPIPKVVFVPVVLLLLGVGDLAKILLIFLILFFQVLVLVRDQASILRPELILSVRSLGAGRRALFRFVYLPASLPAILTALRQSVGTSVAILYIAESFATQHGLGYFIALNGSTLFNYPAMYAGIVAMSILGLGLYFGVDGLERWLCPWLKKA